uniref:Plasma membrane n=1 Tax=Parastrongyloides trichosuri TaxID=131310 RepID=A0A0N5A5G6_PARTI
MVAINWALLYMDVPSSEKDILVKNVTDFVGVLTEEADDLDLLCHMAAEAKAVYENTENDGSFEKLYGKLNKEHPDVMYVIQIMRNKEKQDEVLSRMMASKYGLILQVFSVDEAMDGFKFDNPEGAFEQFCSHIENRLTKMVEEENGGLDLTIFFESSSVDYQLGLSNKKESVVSKLLERKLPSLNLEHVLSPEAYEASALVSGFPVEWNALKVAGIFSNFFIQDIRMVGKGVCLVTFETKYMAAQAIATIVSLKIEDNNKYVFLPLKEEVRDSTNKIVELMSLC